MLTKVVIFNEETREGRDNFGDTERIEITGNQFSYILRNIEGYPALFGYLNAIGEWEFVKADK